jgi:DNA primase
MGTALTDEHARLLRHNAEQVVVCYDGDDAGQAAAWKSIPILEKAGVQVKIAVLPRGLDPDEFISSNGSERFVRDIIEGALSTMSFKLLYMRRNYNLQDIDARRRYMNSAVRMIAELPSPIDREHYIKELSAEFSYSMDAIRQQLGELRQEFLKKQQTGDNNDQSWNTVRNDGPTAERLHVRYAADTVAESLLLYAMMNDAEHAEYVRHQLGDQFSDEVNAALAAYLYAFYAKGSAADPTQFLSMLQDDALIKRASEILHSELFRAVTPEAIEECAAIVLQNVRQSSKLEQLRTNMKQAERAGDPLAAARIAQEIIALEKQLKSS